MKVKLKSVQAKCYPGAGLSKGIEIRRKTLQKEWEHLGKVGGIIDKRIGQKNYTLTEEDKAMRRHIIQKLRDQEEAAFGEGGVEKDDNDPLAKKARSMSKMNKFDTIASDDEDDDGKIGAQVVRDHFFSDGLLVRKEESGVSGNNSTLADLIAASKHRKLERREENEANRDKMDAANVQWSSDVRFMLDHLATSATAVKHRINAVELETESKDLDKLTMELMSARRVAPNGTVVESEEMIRGRQLARLETKLLPVPSAGDVDQQEQAVVSDHVSADALELGTRRIKLMQQHRSADALDEDESPDEEDGRRKRTLKKMLTSEKKEALKHSKIKQRADVPPAAVSAQCSDKSRLHLIRLLAEMGGKQGTAALIYLTHQLTTQTYRGLKDVVRGLYHCHILLDHFTRHKTNNYCSELVAALQRIAALAAAITEDTEESDGVMRPLLWVARDMTSAEPSSYAKLPLLLAESSSTPLHRSAMPHLRLACISRLIQLVSATSQLYADLPSAPALFTSIQCSVLPRMPLDRYPQELADRIRALVVELDLAGRRERQPLNLGHKVKMLPQLEPRFETKFDARKTKSQTRLQLKTKMNREVRGAMRQVRRDARFVADLQLAKQRKEDADRKHKTKMIISTMRQIV